MTHYCQHCHRSHAKDYLCSEKEKAIGEIVSSYSSGQKAEELTQAVMTEKTRMTAETVFKITLFGMTLFEITKEKTSDES